MEDEITYESYPLISVKDSEIYLDDYPLRTLTSISLKTKDNPDLQSDKHNNVCTLDISIDVAFINRLRPD